MAESDKTEHISESIMERFCVRTLSETELTRVARHLTGCPDCNAEFVSTLRRQREIADLSFTLAPEFWLRHEHLDYDQLVDLADNRLDTTDRELIDVHLKMCPPCREDVRAFLDFREQIAPEMTVSYAPIDQKPTRERWSWVIWWRGLASKPVYSAAVVVLGIALMIGAALLLNRRSGNQQVQQMPTPQMSPNSAPDVAGNLPSAPASPIESPTEKPNSGEAIVVLNDQGGTITVDKSGTVTGLDDVSLPTRDEIAKVLLSERLDQPQILKELGGQQGALRGSKTAQPFKLIFPSRTVIVSDRPALRWEEASGASSYRVYINDSVGKEIARSEELPSERTEWTLPKPLKRNEIYTWTVVAVVDGKEIVSPGPSATEMKFQVLSLGNLEQLSQLKKTRSHLALGVFYARVGMILEAEREFQMLSRLNPNSGVAKKLFRRLRLRGEQ
ncbi:MAG: zf-HC2 domain-containing protein [Pyrinomonadaceae bacterium]